MSTLIKCFTAFVLVAFMLMALEVFSFTLALTFVAIFAADLISVVVADFQRTQRQRILAGFNAVAASTNHVLRF